MREKKEGAGEPGREVELREEVPYSGSLKREWEELLMASPFRNPFLTPTWNENWLRHFGQSLEAKALVFRDLNRNLVALGTFVGSEKEQEGKGFSLLGSSDVWDYRDLIIVPGWEEQVCRSLAGYLRESPWQYLELGGISEFSPTARYFPALMQSCGFAVEQEMEEVAVYLDLPTAWETFLEGLNSKNRHELRRKMRRLEKEMNFELSKAEDLLALSGKMEIFFDLHRKSRKDKEEFMTPEMKSYFAEIAARFQERGWLSLTFLQIEGKEVATFFSFEFSGTEYVYNSGYDPEFSRFSPGIVLAALCIRQAIEKRMVRFNFLRGREKYKYQLGGKEEKIYRIRVKKS